MGISRLVLSVLFVVLAMPPASAEEYIFCFPENFRATNRGPRDLRPKTPTEVRHTIHLGSSVPNTVHVHIPSVSFDTVLTIQGGVPTVLQLPGNAIVVEKGTSKHAIFVSAQSPVAITALSSRLQSTEAFSVHSTGQLGTSYVVASFSRLASDLTGLFSIIGTADGTQVRINGPAKSVDFDSSLAAGFMISLGKGEVWTYRAPFTTNSQCDPTGTIINATAPVAVISGHNCAYVPAKTEACNPLYEQLRPIPSLGKSVFVPPLEGRSFSIIRVIAASEGANLTVNGETGEKLASQGFVDLDRKLEPVWIEANQAMQVMLLSPGFNNGDSVGDPCMIAVPSVSDYARVQVVMAITDAEWNNYLTVILPPGHSDDVVIDGTLLADSSVQKHSSSEFRWASVMVTPGMHTISSDEPVGVFVHGFGYSSNAFDAYGVGGSTVLKR